MSSGFVATTLLPLKMEKDSDFEDGSSAADVDAPAQEDDTGTSSAVRYDEDTGGAIHNDHVLYDSGDGSTTSTPRRTSSTLLQNFRRT